MTDLERVWLAVDVSSLWDACRDKHGKDARINFEVLRNVIPSLRGGIDKVNMNASAYIVTHKRATHAAFSEVLTSMEYMVRNTEVAYVDPLPPTRRVMAIHDDWTAGIAVDAMHWLEEYDTFVLAAGHKQFEKLLTYLQNRGKKVIVLTFETPVTKALYEEYADDVFYLTKDIVY